MIYPLLYNLSHESAREHNAMSCELYTNIKQPYKSIWDSKKTMNYDNLESDEDVGL